MKSVRQIVRDKEKTVLSVTSDTNVFKALTMMAAHDIGALVVLDEEKLVGIISERDYARKVALAGRNSRETRVSDVMTKKVISIGVDKSVEEAMAIMTDRHIRHLPVVDGPKVVGVISMRDAVKEVISEHKFVIDQLETYVSRPALS